MGKLTEKLKEGKILVSDGAWGTNMQKKGMVPGECPDMWVIDRPDDIFEIADGYIKAGSDMIETCSFGANRFKLEHFGKQEMVSEINRKAAELSRKAAGDKIVLGSIGPTGKMLLMGDVTEDEMFDAFREQAVALEEGGADAIIIETMSDADEASLAIKAVKENTDLEVVASFTFEKRKTGDYRTMMGLLPEEAARAAKEAGADILGTNCGNGIDRMVEIVAEITKAFPDDYIMAMANAGLPTNIDGVDVFPETPEIMASYVNDLIHAGANIIGGCCGTTADHIKAIRAKVDNFNK